MAFAQEEANTDVAYVDPSIACASGNVNWSSIEWTDAEGAVRTAPISASTDVYISGPRASNYWHPVVEAGSDISMNSLTLAASNSGRNDFKTLEISGTSDAPVTFTIINGLTFSQNFNTIYATNTAFSAGATKMSYLGKLDFTSSNVNLGNVTGGNATQYAFNSTTAVLGSVDIGHSANFNVKDKSDVTIAGWYSESPTINVENSKFTVSTGGFVSANALTMNFTNAEVDVNYGIRNSNNTLTLNMVDSSLLVRNGAYNGGVSSAIYLNNANQKSIVSLSNSTIDTLTKDIFLGTNAESTLTFSNLNAEKTAITCGNLTFAGSLIVDFTDSNITQNTVFTLISATNASLVFDELMLNESVVVKGLKEGEDYEWISEGSLVQLQFYAIPEPSACAAVFGALALAFAAYRRRK